MGNETFISLTASTTSAMKKEEIGLDFFPAEMTLKTNHTSISCFNMSHKIGSVITVEKQELEKKLSRIILNMAKGGYSSCSQRGQIHKQVTTVALPSH